MSSSSQPTEDKPPYTGATVNLSVPNAVEYTEWLVKGLAARYVGDKYKDGKGRIMHAAAVINGGWVFVEDREWSSPDDKPMGMPSNHKQQPNGFALHLMVPSADEWYERAVAAGAAVATPIHDTFYGMRTGTVRDPRGVLWEFSHRLEGAPGGADSKQNSQEPQSPSKKAKK